MEAIADVKDMEGEFDYSEDLRRGMRADIGSTERVKKLSFALRSARAGLCLSRARAYTEVFSQTEGEPVEIRFARAFARAISDLPAVINEGELVVGLSSSGLKKIPVMPESQAGWLIDDLDNLPHRKVDPVQMHPEQIEEAKALLSFWQDKTVCTYVTKFCPPEIAKKVLGTGWAETINLFNQSGCHFNPPWERILEKGLVWYEDRVRERLAAFDYANPEQMGREHFYRALLLVIEAVKDFSTKYAQKARELSSVEKDPERRLELSEISEILTRVPYQGARTFREAVQSMWFIQAILHIEGTGPVYNIGRFDQFMYPYYKNDIEKGELSRAEALELIECLLLKINSNLLLSDSLTAVRNPGFPQHQTICLGGVDRAGKNAANEITELVLEAVKSVRTVQPDIVLLCHPRETSYELKVKSAEMVALGMGMPKFVNTETTKTQLMAMGYSIDEARVGWIKGCTEPYGPGCKQYGHSSAVKLNFAMALETVLFNGRKRTPDQRMSGELIGVETGDPRRFATFDEFLTAVKTQISQQITDGHIASSYVEKVLMTHFPVLLQSLLTEACVERGLGANAGGAEIYTGPGIPIAGGIATISDSLAAIKKLVYDERKITMDALIEAIDHNFEGYEPLRQMLINDAPKYGNDIDYVDDIARDIWQFYTTEVHKLVTPLGNTNQTASCVVMAHVAAGSFTWATPDGRKAGQALSNHIGPAEQRDMNGPVAHIKSVTKLGLDKSFGTVHNMYFTNIDNRQRLHQMVDLIDLYHSLGGHHLQINCQDKRVLLDAQQNPEKYPTLLVRVAGYMANFVELPKYLQDDIICRTSLSV